MEDYWYLLIFAAAFSHAIWNFMLKKSENKQIFLWSLRLWSVILFIPLSIYFWPQESISLKYWLFWGIGSSIIHSFYAIVLAKAYDKSDFTIAYPVARGVGPLIVVIVGLTILKEHVGILTLIGTILVILGIYILYSGLSFKEGIKTFQAITESPWPILVGVTIASYTIFDKLAVAIIPPIILNVIENIGQVVVLGSNLVNQKSKIFEQWKKHWLEMAIGGGFAGLSYILVLIVLTKVPVSNVSPVRETSIVIGSILGFLYLKETFSLQKLLGTIVIFTGVILIIV